MTNTLTYDANGNTTRYTPALGHSTYLTYDAQNNVTQITIGVSEGTSTPVARDAFWYDTDGQRFLGRETWDDGGTQRMRRVLYLGGDYEDVRPPTGTSAYDIIQRIQVTDVVRQVRRRVESTQAWEVLYEYLHRDHLGSVDAITNSAGVVQAKFSFDPFGGRRAQTWTGDLDATGLAALLAWQDSRGSRGFTNHEHLNRTGFIHMNGQVYDPRIGRFVSPDPVVQLPTFSQSYNRYSYALNNPLSYTDPSGFFLKKLFKKAKSAVKSVFKGVGKFIKQFAVDIAIVVIGIYNPQAGSALLRARAAQRTASATMRRSRAGPDGGGGGTPGIVGPVTVFGLEVPMREHGSSTQRRKDGEPRQVRMGDPDWQFDLMDLIGRGLGRLGRSAGRVALEAIEKDLATRELSDRRDLRLRIAKQWVVLEQDIELYEYINYVILDPKSTGGIIGKPRPAGPGEEATKFLERIAERVPDEPPHSIRVIDVCLFGRCYSNAR